MLLALGVAAVLAYAFPSLQLVHRYAVMAAALIPYGLVAFAGAAIIFATSGRRSVRLVAVLAVAGLVLQLWWARLYWPATATEPNGPSLTLLTMNMRCDTRGIKDLVALTDRVKPDVVVLQGFYGARREALGDVWAELLPYATFHPMPRLPSCGTFVFSRTPLQQLLATGDAQPVVRIEGPDGPIVLLPVDLPTPGKGVAPWLDSFTHLGEVVNSYPGASIVAAGDFNAVREHDPMRRLLADTGPRDAAEVAGRGWAPTFPSRVWHPPLIGLDHVFVSAGLDAFDIRTQRIPGQEHRALVVRIGRG